MVVEEGGLSHLKNGIRFEVEGQRMNGRPKRMWKKQIEEEGV